MPAKSPPVSDLLASRLLALGERVRAHREHLKISATVVAEAAGMSRVTLHRIERGEPSVTIGAYLSAIDTVGLQLDLCDPQVSKRGSHEPHLPASVKLDDYPQLRRLARQLHGVAELSPADALSLYERNWRHVDQTQLEPTERALLQTLMQHFGGGRLLV